MARYRKIDTRMWGDSRFRKLSSPNPSGKYLWIFLLTGPHTSNIPGLFRAGEMALAEELEWSMEGFREGFREAFREGLVKADWKARVVWVPNAIKYNVPESPNVVKSWRTAWDEIPECALKVEAYERLKAFTEGLGEGFGKAFAEGCPKGLANQEQEQEQEQNNETHTCTLSESKTDSDVSLGENSLEATTEKGTAVEPSQLELSQSPVKDDPAAPPTEKYFVKFQIASGRKKLTLTDKRRKMFERRWTERFRLHRKSGMDPVEARKAACHDVTDALNALLTSEWHLADKQKRITWELVFRSQDDFEKRLPDDENPPESRVNGWEVSA